MCAVMYKLVFICAIAALAKCNEEYFWRDWNSGSPPSDALSGWDYRGASYIVEAYAPNYGLFVGQAFANQREVNISALHVNTTLLIQRSHAIKVLCAQNKDQLAWYPTNYRSLDEELLAGTINPVVGGINDNDDVLYVGRYVNINTRTVHIGSICRNFHLHYHYNNNAYSQLYFEILIVVKDKCNQ